MSIPKLLSPVPRLQKPNRNNQFLFPVSIDASCKDSPITPESPPLTGHDGHEQEWTLSPTNSMPNEYKSDDNKNTSSFNNDENDRQCPFQLNGYKIIRTISDTIQGHLYQAIRLKDNLSVAIKQTSKSLHKSRTAKQDEDGMNIVVAENIILESIILHHLTVANTPISDSYICKFIDFCETEHDYCLICEYIEGNTTLRQFIHQCHSYINLNKLLYKDYKKMVRYLFWQISAAVHWMHDDMSCVHMDLNVDNIMVENATFIPNPDGDGQHMLINPDINIKIVDFGLSEIFKSDILHLGDDNNEESKSDDNDNDDDSNDNPFLCGKYEMNHNHAYVSPEQFNCEIYDARSTDIWSLGIILFTMSVGVEPYKYPNAKSDAGYWSLQSIDDFAQYLRINNYTKYINHSLMFLIAALLNMNESNRLNIKQVLDSQYLSAYYRRYSDRIHDKSQSQRIQNYAQREKMRDFPFYELK